MRLHVISLLLLLIGASAVGSDLTPAHTFGILVVEEMLGRVTILAADDPLRRVPIAVGFKPHEIAVSADGKAACV